MKTKRLPSEHTFEEHKDFSPETVKYCDIKDCDDGWNEYWYDETTVSCDQLCGALTNPRTLLQWKGAAIHWESHSVNSGCSHGN